MDYFPPRDKDRDLIKTLFVSGLPDDIKAREIHNLFRRRPGFNSCQLKYTGRGNQVVAFATFSNHQSAMAALLALDGIKFDPHSGSLLHVELARTNSRRKNRPGSGPYVVIDNRTKKSEDAEETSSDEGESETDEITERANEDFALEAETVAAKSEPTSDPENAKAAENEHVDNEKTTIEGVRSCSTLFIANLGPNCTEKELTELLSQYPGFNALKIRSRVGMPVAFADFEEVEQAAEVMEVLQGSQLSSSDRGGMHIEYARSKMRKR